jgi:Flp pilus assembly protein TadD
MIRRSLPLFVCLIVLFSSRAAWSQAIPNHSPFGTTLRPIEKQVWHVFGQVKTLDGQPARDAKVRVDIGTGPGLGRTIGTDLQGKFDTQYELDVTQYTRLSLTLVASKPGYLDARETVDFGASDKTWGIDLTLREKSQDPDQLSLADLVRSVAPRLRQRAARDLQPTSAAKDWERGAHDLLDRQDALGAVPLLAKVAQREPRCIDCRLMLGLAQLDAGSWDSATRQFSDIAKLSSEDKSARRPEPSLILGVLESWRHETKKAAGFFTQALDAAPGDPLVLQELGRALVLDHNWEAADEYLAKAIKAGAPAESHLLRTKALLGMGDVPEADAEMRTYLAGRDVKEMPAPVRALYTELQDRLRLTEYASVKSAVTQPVAELTRAVPELRGLEPASVQDELPTILEKAGENVRAFFESFPNTISTEQIRQQRLRQDGHVRETQDQKYAYLLLARAEKQGQRLGLEEYRATATGERTMPHGLEGGFMLTTGFASAALVFHPAYQRGASFRFLGVQTINGHKALVVGFAQRPETARTVERFNVDDASVLILLQGVVWLDAGTYQIIRMRTDLLKPASKVRLARQTTEIQFSEVHFKELTSAFWLPREVVVTVEWKGRMFRNLHQYSDFKLFNVQSEEKRKAA